MSFLKSWLFWIFLVAAGLFGFQLILWGMKKAKITSGAATALENATGVSETL